MEREAIVANTLIDECLLNDGPKQDCLVHICEYLSVNDLMNLSDASQFTELFTDFVNDRVNFATKPFDLIEAGDHENVFQYFGRSMQKVKVNN